MSALDFLGLVEEEGVNLSRNIRHVMQRSKLSTQHLNGAVYCQFFPYSLLCRRIQTTVTKSFTRCMGYRYQNCHLTRATPVYVHTCLAYGKGLACLRLKPNLHLVHKTKAGNAVYSLHTFYTKHASLDQTSHANVSQHPYQILTLPCVVM